MYIEIDLKSIFFQIEVADLFLVKEVLNYPKHNSESKGEGESEGTLCWSALQLRLISNVQARTDLEMSNICSFTEQLHYLKQRFFFKS